MPKICTPPEIFSPPLSSHPKSALGQRYADAVGYIRERIRFEILKTTVIALRGDRGARLRSAKNVVNVGELDLNLELRLFSDYL